MENTEKLEQLVTLAIQFKAALAERFVSPAMKTEMQNPEEFAKVAAFLDKETLELNLQTADLAEGLAERLYTKGELAEYLPEGLQNAEAATFLKKYGANNLAALVEYKLSR